MKVAFFDLNRQFKSLETEITKGIQACLLSGAFIEGPLVRELEQRMAAYLGVKHVITCANGTDALMLALRNKVQRGDEVITTPFSFFATAEAISAIGAIPVFADIKGTDYNIDPLKIEEKITPKTRAILPVHIFGAPADMDEINAIAGKHNLYVVEDACQAIGTEYKGKKTGALADAGCFSFYPTKNLGAFGDAGMITTDSDEINTVCRALKAHSGGKTGYEAYRILGGGDDSALNLERGDDPLYDPAKYYNFLIGCNSRLDSLQAAVLLAKLPELDRFNARRAAIASKYNEALAQTGLKLPTESETFGKSCWHQYAVMTEDKLALAGHLTEHGVGTGAFYPVPLHLQKAYAGLHAEGECPVAEAICKQSLCLPIYPELTDDEQDYVIEQVLEFYN